MTRRYKLGGRGTARPPLATLRNQHLFFARDQTEGLRWHAQYETKNRDSDTSCSMCAYLGTCRSVATPVRMIVCSRESDRLSLNTLPVQRALQIASKIPQARDPYPCMGTQHRATCPCSATTILVGSITTESQRKPHYPGNDCASNPISAA